MSELVVVEKEYKIFKNRTHNIFNKKTNDLLNGTLFVSCGIDTGEILGRVNKIGNKISMEYSKAVEDGSIASPLVLFCETISQAKAMFENLKKDKSRFSKLAAEVQKQRIMNKLSKETEKLENTGQISPVSISQENTTTPERGKRLALNNGIFKSNDNY